MDVVLYKKRLRFNSGGVPINIQLKKIMLLPIISQKDVLLAPKIITGKNYTAMDFRLRTVTK